MAGFTMNNALMGVLQPAKPKPYQRSGFSFVAPTSTGVNDAGYGVRSVSMDPYDVAVRAVEAKNGGASFSANPTDILNFEIPLQRGIGHNTSIEIPQWLADQAKQYAGRTGFSLAGPEAMGVHAQPGALGDTTYKVGDTIFSGAHTGGYAADANTDIARRFDPNSFVSYANSPEYQQALATGKWTMLNGTPYNVLDNTGKVIGTKKFEGLEDEDNMDMIALALTGAAIGGMGLTAAGGAGAGAAGAAGGGAEGAAAGAGVTGFGDAGAMYAGLDAGAAGSLGGGATALGGSGALGAGAGAAGVTGLGDAGAMYGGLDAAGASSLGGGASVGGAAGGSTASGLGSLLKGAGMSGFSWTDLIGPGLNAIGGIFGAKAAGDAADAQLKAAREAMALNEPFRQGGMKGLNRLLDLLGISGNTKADGYGSAAKSFGAEDFQADPGYAFRQSEQERALEHAAAARGLLGSGKYLKDAMRYSGDLASQEYGNAFNRFQAERAAKLNPLQSLMGAGQTSANTIADYRTQAGNAQAAGTVGQANALSNAIGQGYSMYANQQQQNQNNALLRSILGV